MNQYQQQTARLSVANLYNFASLSITDNECCSSPRSAPHKTTDSFFQARFAEVISECTTKSHRTLTYLSPLTYRSLLTAKSMCLVLILHASALHAGPVVLTLCMFVMLWYNFNQNRPTIMWFSLYTMQSKDSSFSSTMVVWKFSSGSTQQGAKQGRSGRKLRICSYSTLYLINGTRQGQGQFRI